MAGLHILKYSENLSEERLCEVWAENSYFQYFCGEEFFQHKLVFDRSLLTRWRQHGPSSARKSASPPLLRRQKGGQFILHAKALPGNPYDGHTLKAAFPASKQ